MRQPPSLAPVAALVIGAGGMSTATGVAAQEVQFDLKQLERNGVSADVARFFARQAGFLPGVHQVDASVNGMRREPLQVRFDAQGEPCFSAEVLAQLGLKQDDPEQACAPLQQIHPGTRVELRPGSARMDLVVPATALRDSSAGGAFQRGGNALVLNYDVFSQRVQRRTGNDHSLSARMELGFNTANWAVRSRGDYARRRSQSRYVQQETYAQRALERASGVFQAGQLSLASEGFGGTPMLGAQLFSDDMQRQASRLSVPIEGIADSHAVVEVRQRGSVVHRSVVAPGAYSISDIAVTHRGTDLDVEVREEDGRTTRYRVPAPMDVPDADAAPAFQLGVGRYRARDGVHLQGNAPWLVHAGGAAQLRADTRVSTSLLLARDYQGLAAQSGFSLGSRSTWGVGARFSHAAQWGFGHELQLQGNASFDNGLSMGASWQRRSAAFATLEDTLPLRDTRPWPCEPWTLPEACASRDERLQQSLSASLGWSSASWGAFSYTFWQSRYGGDVGRGQTLSASRRFGRVNVNLTLQHAQGRGSAAFVNLQVPLGRGSVSARAYRYEDASRNLGASFQSRTAGGLAYNVDASHSGSQQRLAVAASQRTAYGAFNAGASHIQGQAQTQYLAASGGVALASGRTLAFSSSRIGDTFAVVRIPRVAGIGLSGAGSATTSVLGTAVLPSVTPYRRTRLQLDGRTLPLNQRFASTTLDLALARGAVATPTISAHPVRQLLLTVRTRGGELARVGTALYSAEGDFIGTVIGQGNAILDNEQIGKPVLLDDASGRCEVHYRVPARFDPARPYEASEGRCL
ncbi:TPA: fimbrial biogenesis outer membrane usher protein [Stenotrophomonas maltophilia]|nr:fimbrial biogenesis outer membrane usher protein [Stenotrophomonas maltophilia]